MEPKKLAEVFGMTVAALAEFVCYDRRSMYNIIQNPNGANRKRFKAVERLLIYKAKQDLDREQKEAKAKYDKRMAALQRLHNKHQGNSCVGIYARKEV